MKCPECGKEARMVSSRRRQHFRTRRYACRECHHRFTVRTPHTTQAVGYPAPICPLCGSDKGRRVRTACGQQGYYRRYECQQCTHRWNVEGRPGLPLPPRYPPDTGAARILDILAEFPGVGVTNAEIAVELNPDDPPLTKRVAAMTVQLFRQGRVQRRPHGNHERWFEYYLEEQPHDAAD